MLRLDSNLDGKEDLVISHLDRTAALLTNTTVPAGNFLAIRFIGTNSSRDAIGTRVDLFIRDRRKSMQLAAGDGYMASNERQLVSGLGGATISEKLIISWPNNKQQETESLTADHIYAVVETRATAINCQSNRSTSFRGGGHEGKVLPLAKRERAQEELTLIALFLLEMIITFWLSLDYQQSQSAFWDGD